MQLETERAPDSTLFAERRQNSDHCHLTPCDTTSRGRSWIKRRNRFRKYPGVPEISVSAYKGIYDPQHVVFSVHMTRTSKHQFAEWYSLPRGTFFAYQGPEPRRAFKLLYGKRHFYQDVALEFPNDGTSGVVRLKENGAWIELPVDVMRDPGSSLTEERWAKAMKSYRKALSKREARFDRDIARELARYHRVHDNIPRTAWRRAKRAMNDQEKAMALTAWMPYANERPYRTPETPGESPWAMFAKERTSISVYGFGMVNCDRYLVMPEQQTVIASTADDAGAPFPWVRGYAVPKGRNAVITYMGVGDGLTDRLLVAPGYVEALFLVDKDGNVARADVRPLNRSTSKAVLHVSSVSDAKTIDQLRATAQR